MEPLLGATLRAGQGPSGFCWAEGYGLAEPLRAHHAGLFAGSPVGAFPPWARRGLASHLWRSGLTGQNLLHRHHGWLAVRALDVQGLAHGPRHRCIVMERKLAADRTEDARDLINPGRGTAPGAFTSNIFPRNGQSEPGNVRVRYVGVAAVAEDVSRNFHPSVI